jgi:hypothetical protein
MSAGNRLAWVLIAAGFLYAGPVLSGLAGGFSGAVPVFGLIFMLYMTLMRPGLWPRDLAGWTDLKAWRTFAWVALVQLVLVWICVWIGGLIYLSGLELPIDPRSPVILSLGGVILGRMAWTPAMDAPEMDAFLDDALDRIDQINEALDRQDKDKDRDNRE